MIQEKLQDIFREIFEDEKIILRRDMTAEDIEDWDSLTHIQLIETVENTFHITFTLQEAIGLETVGEFIELVKEKTGEKE